MGKKAQILLPIIFVFAILLSVIIAASIGVVSIPVEVLFDMVKSALGFPSQPIPDYYEITLWQLRLPRIVMSLLTGASLAICGSVFQTIFRNPICDPYILGISSGASLGAAVAFILGWDAMLLGITIPALATALITLFLILGIARFNRNKNIETILLTGIATNFLISAVITLLLVVNQQEMNKIIFWTMGSFATVSWHEIKLLLPIFLICLSPLYYYAKDLNIMQLGIESAKSLGVDTRKTTFITLLFSSILIATAVSFCGVIGFIGLIIPHIVRIIFGNHNRRLLTYSLFFGAFFMLLADTLARTIAIPSELPVGSITAMAGAPYFIYLLLRKGSFVHSNH
ncbi:MAG: iron ABC transporter permease [Bacteroidales bacterium]